VKVIRTPRSYTAELALDAHDGVGESPVWDVDTQRLLWVDIPGRALRTFHPSTRATSSLALAAQISVIALRSRGGLVGAGPGFVLLDDRTGALQRVAGGEVDEPPLNEGRCDRAGRFWAGSLAVDPRFAGRGVLGYLGPDGVVRTALAGVTVSNGLDWSPDGETLYYTDSPTQRLDAFDFEPETGALSRRRTVVEIPNSDGTPDGLTVDRDGNLWLALVHGSEVRCYTPDGALDARVRVPTSVVTSCCFGGADLEDLYITTSELYVPDDLRASQAGAGGLFVCRPGATGVAPSRFGG
jgi:sugar lactone lactonase YvrE